MLETKEHLLTGPSRASHMKSEVMVIEVELATGAINRAELSIWEQIPDNPENVMLALKIQGMEVQGSGSNFFDAMNNIRQIIEKEGMLLRCNGASRNVYPSGMSRNMGSGEKAYKLTLGQPARLADLVSIFDSDPDISPVSVKEQEAFYNEWLRSLTRT